MSAAAASVVGSLLTTTRSISGSGAAEPVIPSVAETGAATTRESSHLAMPGWKALDPGLTGRGASGDGESRFGDLGGRANRSLHETMRPRTPGPG